MIKEITKSEFKERFPKARTYSDLGTVQTICYLENGVILLNSEWNGEEYNVDGKIYKPVYAWNTITDQGSVIGYENWENS